MDGPGRVRPRAKECSPVRTLQSVAGRDREGRDKASFRPQTSNASGVAIVVRRVDVQLGERLERVVA